MGRGISIFFVENLIRLMFRLFIIYRLNLFPMRTLAGFFLKFENDFKIHMEIQLIQKIRAEEILLPHFKEEYS